MASLLERISAPGETGPVRNKGARGGGAAAASPYVRQHLALVRPYTVLTVCVSP